MTENEPNITVIEPEYYEEAELLAIMETTGKGPAYYLQHYSPEVHSDYCIYCELNDLDIDDDDAATAFMAMREEQFAAFAMDEEEL